MKTLVLTAIAALALTSAANAAIIPVLSSVTVDGLDFKYTYDGQLAPDQGVKSGDQLVIIDFKGYVPGSISSPYATVTPSISNTLPAGLLIDGGFTDDPTIPDLIYTYTGTTAFHTSGGPYPGQTDFFGLTADSTFGTTAIGSFSAEATVNNGPLTGTNTFNVGEVSVPAPVGVPEPLTLSLFGAGLVGAGLLRRRKTAKTV